MAEGSPEQKPAQPEIGEDTEYVPFFAVENRDDGQIVVPNRVLLAAAAGTLGKGVSDDPAAESEYAARASSFAGVFLNDVTVWASHAPERVRALVETYADVNLEEDRILAVYAVQGLRQHDPAFMR